MNGLVLLIWKMSKMSAKVLTLSPSVREANLDVKAIERRLRAEGYEWGPALAEARRRMMCKVEFVPPDGRVSK